jgi:2-iminobutanoate/2-iminopropanoate deaminase
MSDSQPELTTIPASDAARWPTRAVKARGWLFASGSIGADPRTGEVPSELATQTTLALESLGGLLESAGSAVGRIVKVNVYLSDIQADFDRMDEAYKAFFQARGVEDPPARTTVGATLPWAKVEIDLIALCP